MLFTAATAFRAGRQGNPVTTIVVHYWGDPANNPTFDGTVEFFKHGGNNTSAHYVVEAGRVVAMVKESDTAFHAGTWAMNLMSIGIECNPRASDEDKRAVAELILDIQSRKGPLHIIGHQDNIPTDCPGRYYPPAVTLAPWLNGTTPQPQLEQDDEMFVTASAPGSYRLNTDAGSIDLGTMGNVDAVLSAINAKVTRTWGPNGWQINPPPAPCLDSEAATLNAFLSLIHNSQVRHTDTNTIAADLIAAGLADAVVDALKARL